MGARARTQDDRHQARRAWRAAREPGYDLQGPRVPTAGGVRSHRRWGRVRGGLHGLPRVDERPEPGEPAARHGLRRRDGLVRGRSIRHPGARARHPGRRAGAGAGLQGPGPLRVGRGTGRGGMTERYAAAGVRLDVADEAKRRIAAIVKTTRTTLALGEIGAFGGMVRVPPGYERPVLVFSTDGVGTKVLVAARAGIHDTVGEDLVNHCVNDVLVHGARPLAFLDYLATAELDPETAGAIVAGVARGCRAHEMTLAGGETAQLPDLYEPGHYDLAGMIVGVVEESAALHGDLVRPGDVLIGYASNGLHTNGYTLARRIVFDELGLDVHDEFPETGRTVAQVLLDVHRSYAAAVNPVLSRLHALAHITGGGIPGNLVRVLPDGCEAVVDARAWRWPPVFRVLMRAGEVSLGEMRRVFNLGIGMIAIAARDDTEAVIAAAKRAGVEAWIIGEIRPGTTAVKFAER